LSFPENSFQTPVQINVERHVHSDPITGSPFSPQYEEPFTLARGDFTSLLTLITLAIEGSSMLQLTSLEMEVQDILQEARMAAMNANTRALTVTTSSASTLPTGVTVSSTAPSTPPRDPFSQYFGRYPALDSPL
jgi:hypothetical protein